LEAESEKEVKEMTGETEKKAAAVTSGIPSYVLAAGIIAALVIGAVAGSYVLPQEQPSGQNGLSADAVSAKLEVYLNENSEAITGKDLEFKVTDINRISEELYFVVIEAGNNGVIEMRSAIYATSSAGYIIAGTLIDLSENLPKQPEVEMVKQEKPEVEVFVMSHCPFGLQMEKGILPVVKLLKDSIDFRIRFVDYAMHGAVEVNEQTAQYCIQEEQTDKYIDYLSCFMEDGNSGRCLAEVDINTQALAACVAAADTEFAITENLEDTSLWIVNPQTGEPRFPRFLVDAEANNEYKVQSTSGWGSPILVINGTYVESAPRNPAGLLGTLCSGFTDEPEECTAQLSTETPSDGFGYDGAGDDGGGGCGAS
jgi:hypothetical protein